MQKKIAIFAPHYPPEQGGVSDYTYKLFQEFQNQEIPSIVITKKSSQRENSNEIIEVDIPTRLSSLQEVIKKHNITDLLIEYTPKSFNPKTLGLNFWLVFHIMRLRRQVNIHLYAHETNFPIEFSKAGLILGPIHTLQFYLMALLSKTTTFSTKRFEQKWRKRLPTKKIHMYTVPIGSNIEPSLLYTEEKKDQVIFFGSKHPTCLRDQALETMLYIAEKLPHINFIILGLTQKDFPLSSYQHRFIFPGYLESKQISKYFNESKLSILPLMDGCSTRRGTLMCSLAHGTPVLTNFGHSTDLNLPWSEFCYIAKPLNFNEQAIDALTNNNILKIKQEKSLEYYKDHFAWPVITKQMMKIMSKSV